MLPRGLVSLEQRTTTDDAAQEHPEHDPARAALVAYAPPP